MSNEIPYFISQLDDETGSGWDRTLVSPAYRDDGGGSTSDPRQISGLIETIASVGGEVARIRVELDELLTLHEELLQSFGNLRKVMEAKGTLDLDDYELACEVLETTAVPRPVRRIRDLAQ